MMAHLEHVGPQEARSAAQETGLDSLTGVAHQQRAPMGRLQLEDNAPVILRARAGLSRGGPEDLEGRVTPRNGRTARDTKHLATLGEDLPDQGVDRAALRTRREPQLRDREPPGDLRSPTDMIEITVGDHHEVEVVDAQLSEHW